MSNDRNPDDAKRKLPTDADDRKALHLAETTDVSVGQAHDLIRKHGKDSPALEEAAKNFKAEG
jgi:hypothetical protein